MDAPDILLVVLLVVASIACGFAIWAMREAAATARALRLLSDDTRTRLVPLLEKVDVTVDAVNAELLRVDAIITQFETASARVSHASDTLSNVVSAPGEIVNDVATRVRRAWKERRRADEAAADHGDPAYPDTSDASVDAASEVATNSMTDEPRRSDDPAPPISSAQSATEDR